MARVALGDIAVHSAWQAWHLWRWAGSGGALGPRLALVAAAVCVAGVALGGIDVHSAWQAWQLCWRGWPRLATLSPRLFVWQAWRLATSTFNLAWHAWHLATSTFTLRGRRGTWRHRPSLCVADVALGDIDVHSAWQAWRLWHWPGSGVAGVALGDIDVHAAWQAWYLATSTFTLRGRRGAWRHRRAFCVARGDIGLHFAWQAWHLATWTFHLPGRRGTWRHRRAFCAAGVGLVALGWLWWRAWTPLSPRLFEPEVEETPVLQFLRVSYCAILINHTNEHQPATRENWGCCLRVQHHNLCQVRNFSP